MLTTVDCATFLRAEIVSSLWPILVLVSFVFCLISNGLHVIDLRYKQRKKITVTFSKNGDY